MAAIRASFRPDDTIECVKPEQLAGGNFDAVVITQIAGYSNLPPQIAAANLPAFCLESYRGYHSYHAAFYRELTARGGTVLPAMLPEEIEASVRALRARRALRGAKLIVVEPAANRFRMDQIPPLPPRAANGLAWRSWCATRRN